MIDLTVVLWNPALEYNYNTWVINLLNKTYSKCTPNLAYIFFHAYIATSPFTLFHHDMFIFGFLSVVVYLLKLISFSKTSF